MGFELLNGLRARFAAADAGACIAVQHLVLGEGDIGVVQAMLDKAGQELAVRFKLERDRGDIVLLDACLAARLSPQLVEALKDGRPTLVIAGSRRGDASPLSVAERFERRQHELLHQLRKMALVRQRAVPGDADQAAAPAGERRQDDQAAPYDSGFDSRLDAEALVAEGPHDGQWQVLQHALRGSRDPDTERLSASYGAGASMLFNFRTRLVSIDPLALQHLRARRELPQPAPDALPGSDATPRALDATVWDLGIAGADLPLVEAPADWWHAPLISLARARAESHTLVPRYLDVARRIQAAQVTPSQLRRQARIGVPDLRAVLQACLMSGQAQWLNPRHNQENF